MHLLQRLRYEFAQLGRVRGGEQHRAGNRIDAVCTSVLGLIFFHHHVVVGAAKAKRADARAAGRAALCADPRAGLGVDVKGGIFNAKLGVWLGDVDGGGQYLVVQRQRSFDQAGGARGGLGVRDLRLDAAQGDVLLARIVLGEHFVDALELRRVARHRASAVRFHQANRGRLKTGFIVGAAQSNGLPSGAWGVNALVAPVGRGANGFDDRVNPVAIALGVFQPLKHHHAQALAHHHPARFCVEGADVFLLGEGGGLAEAHVRVDRVIGVHAAGEHQFGAALDQLTNCHLDRRERAGACCIDHAVCAAQVEAVANTPGNHIANRAGEGVFFPAHVG